MPKIKDIEKVAKNTDKFLESNIVNHRRRLAQAITTLENNIIDMAADFKTKDGTLLGPRVNMKQAQKIHSKLKTMFDETYGKEARSVVAGFNRVATQIKRDYKNLDVVMDYTSVDKDMIKVLKKNSWKTFNQFGLQSQERLVDTMYNSVLGKQSFSSMVNAFSAVLSGHRDKKGRPMSAYADLYAHDSIMDFHNAVNMKKADDLGFKYFLYYGNIMNTSRDFCRERIGKVFSKEEIESWDFPWGGKSGPAMTNRGGYNCRHHWRPVRKSWLGNDAEFWEVIGGVPDKAVIKLTGLAKKLAESKIEGKIIEDLFLKDMDDAIDAIMTNLDLDTLKPLAVKKAKKQIYESTQYHLKHTRELPDKFIVYRGGGTRDELSSVTLNKANALTFARGNKNKVKAYMVKRSDILVDVNSIKGASQSYPGEEELILYTSDLIKSPAVPIKWAK